MLARKALLMKTEHSSLRLQRRPCSIEAEACNCTHRKFFTGDGSSLFKSA
jgi:hypothetical protein